MAKEIDLKKKVIAGLIYPIILICVAALVITMLIVVVFPRFAEIFMQAGAKLPLPTRALIAFSNFLRFRWALIIGCAAGVIAISLIYARTLPGRLFIDKMKLRIPLFGSLIRKSLIARIARAMEIMARAGVNIVPSLRIAGNGAGNIVFQRKLAQVESAVSEGQALSPQLAKSGEFPPLATRMIEVGEVTGRLDDAFRDVADEYELEVDYAVKNMTTVIEPVMIALIAVVVAFIAASMFLPLFSMIEIIK